VPTETKAQTSWGGAGPLQDRTRALAGPVARRLWHIDRDGYDRIPTDGPAILCPNHISFLDSAFLMLTMPRRISFVGKAEYMNSWKTKYLFPAMGMIPIDRGGGRRSDAALDAAATVLGRGELFGIFPEGTRSRDGALYKGHTGAARLALQMGCPIIPVGISGTADIQPPNAKVPKLFKACSIRIGRPVDVTRYDADDRMAYRRIMDEVMFEIRDLTGQEYRDRYAGKGADDGREALAAPPAHVAHVDDNPAPDPARAPVPA
jgi:1-acyl-sn-glycerol-3-phosphate acyltransferase